MTDNTEVGVAMERIELDNGKYTVVNELNNGGDLYALRHGETWRNLNGDNLVLAMFHEIERLRGALEFLGKSEEGYRQNWYKCVSETKQNKDENELKITPKETMIVQRGAIPKGWRIKWK